MHIDNKATPAMSFTLPKPKKGRVIAPAAIKITPSVMPAITPTNVLVVSILKRDLSEVFFSGETPTGRSPKAKSNIRPIYPPAEAHADKVPMPAMINPAPPVAMSADIITKPTIQPPIMAKV